MLRVLLLLLLLGKSRTARGAYYLFLSYVPARYPEEVPLEDGRLELRSLCKGES